MYRANTYRLSEKQIASRIAVGRLPALRLGGPAATNWDGIIHGAIATVPSWIYLGMILLAGVAICMTVNLRGRAQLQSAQGQFSHVSSEVEALRKTNSDLKREIQRISTEPALIESAARARLGMVRATDIVVPVQSRAKTNLATLSFVR